MRRAESQERTRQALVGAAAEVFGERGLHGASLDDVAARAGFTKGAVYSNFASKEELILEGFKASFSSRRSMANDLNRRILAGDLEGASQTYREIWRDIDMTQWLLGIEFLLWAKRDGRIREMVSGNLNESIEAAASDLLAGSNDDPPADLRSKVIALAALELGLGLLDEVIDEVDRSSVYVATAAALLET